MKLIPSALAIALFANSVQASDSWFEVELILFERHGEQSQQPDEQAPQVYSGIKNIELVQQQQLRPSYPVCPPLTQQQRFDLSRPTDMTENDVIDAAKYTGRIGVITLSQPATELASLGNNENTTELEQAPEPETCQAPDETLFQQAYDIRASRLNELAALQSQDLFSDKQLNDIQLSDDQATLDLPSNNTDYQQDMTPQGESTVEPAFNALVFNPYPAELIHGGIVYEIKPYSPVEPLTTVPKVIFAEQLATELLQTHLLDEDSLQLSQLRKKMRWQKALTPILHIGWRQPVYARHLAVPFHLFGGKNFADSYLLDGSKIDGRDVLVTQQGISTPDNSTAYFDKSTLMSQNNEEQPPQPSIDINEIVSELTQQLLTPPLAPLWELDGMLKIYLNRFLFIEADFDLRKPGQAQRLVSTLPSALLPFNENTLEDDSPAQTISLVKQPPGSELPVAQDALVNDSVTEHGSFETLQTVDWLNNQRLLQHRRVRSKEIHYFDHPKLGMIIQIRRFDVEAFKQDVKE